MTNFPNSHGRKVVLALVQTIIDNKAHLSEVDGKIGDGDHGINMAKGFHCHPTGWKNGYRDPELKRVWGSLSVEWV